jgi:aspartate-semialdehyde dehydrogenase
MRWTSCSRRPRPSTRNGELVNKKFPKRIAFNVIPQIDVFMEDGYTKEEWKMMMETKKILDPKIKLTATCVRVPVFIGHSEASTSNSRSRSRPMKRATSCAMRPACLVIDKREPGGYITPYEAAGEDATYISRIREDSTVENGLVLVRLGQPAQGRGAERVQIAEVPDQPQADHGEEGGPSISNNQKPDAQHPAFLFYATGRNSFAA